MFIAFTIRFSGLYSANHRLEVTIDAAILVAVPSKPKVPQSSARQSVASLA